MIGSEWARIQALEAQLYALYRHLKAKGVLTQQEAKLIAIDAQESCSSLSNADEVVEVIRSMTGVRPLK